MCIIPNSFIHPSILSFFLSVSIIYTPQMQNFYPQVLTILMPVGQNTRQDYLIWGQQNIMASTRDNADRTQTNIKIYMKQGGEGWVGFQISYLAKNPDGTDILPLWWISVKSGGHS